MSYLVLCPTCGGKMSVNARVCPHCGDRGFIVPETAMLPSPCDYRDYGTYALGCEGKGFLCRKQIWGGVGIHPVRYLQAMGVRALSSYVRVADGLYAQTSDNALRERIARAVARNDVYVKSWVFKGVCEHELYEGKVRCPQCNGTGKVAVEQATGNYIDIRKRA